MNDMNRRTFFGGLAALAAGCGLGNRTPAEPSMDIADATWSPVAPGTIKCTFAYDDDGNYCEVKFEDYIDGIRFDEWGNILWYDVLPP